MQTPKENKPVKQTLESNSKQSWCEFQLRPTSYVTLGKIYVTLEKTLGKSSLSLPQSAHQ